MSKSTSESLREVCPGFDPSNAYPPISQTVLGRSRPGSPLHTVTESRNGTAASLVARRRKEPSQSPTPLQRRRTGSISEGRGRGGQHSPQALSTSSSSALSLNQTLIPESTESEERHAGTDTRVEKLNWELEQERQQKEYMHQENQRIQVERDSIHKEWIQAADELSELRAARSHKIDDGYIEGIWKLLKYEVKNWAMVNFGGELRGSLRTRRRDETILAIERTANTTNGRKYLRSGSQRPTIVQAVVWAILLEDVFESPSRDGGFLWAGGDACHLRALRKNHQPRKPSEELQFVRS